MSGATAAFLVLAVIVASRLGQASSRLLQEEKRSESLIVHRECLVIRPEFPAYLLQLADWRLCLHP